MNGRIASARVLDAKGRPLSPCSHEKARKLLAQGEASLVSEEPLTIQLPYSVDKSPQAPARQAQTSPIEPGSKVLLHVCCGPCSTYPINWLQEQGYDVIGLWYNPNIHPWLEHEERRASAEAYAEAVGLEMIWAEAYEMPWFFRLVAGHERFRERCMLCYRLRLEWTARVAVRREFDAFTTTLADQPTPGSTGDPHDRRNDRPTGWDTLPVREFSARLGGTKPFDQGARLILPAVLRVHL